MIGALIVLLIGVGFFYYVSSEPESSTDQFCHGAGAPKRRAGWARRRDCSPRRSSEMSGPQCHAARQEMAEQTLVVEQEKDRTSQGTRGSLLPFPRSGHGILHRTANGCDNNRAASAIQVPEAWRVEFVAMIVARRDAVLLLEGRRSDARRQLKPLSSRLFRSD